jgi:phytepsin
LIWSDLFTFLLDPSGVFSAKPARGGQRRTSLPAILDPSSTHSRLKARQLGLDPETVDLALGTWSSVISPPVPRLIAEGMLLQPLVSITLQRDAVDIDSGNPGMLSIGELPSGVEFSDLTWVPLRSYTIDEGGIPGPPDSPFETYPFTWEIQIDNVFLDGMKLPQSTLTPSFIGTTALLDTGDPLIRGPADVITFINEQFGTDGIFDCAKPHVLSFEIGGTLFPVDPRDLIWQQVRDTVGFCRAKLATTVTPEVGNFLFSWSLGVPFLKSVLSSYYFGNITHPSQDPPKLGLLSTVPFDAGDLLKSAVASASSSGNLPFSTQSPPDYSATSMAPEPTPLVESKMVPSRDCC